MSERDRRAVYRSLKSLGEADGLGEPAPDFVPPGGAPKTPFIVMVPQNLPPGPAADAR